MTVLSGITARSVLSGAQQLGAFRAQGSALTALENDRRTGREERGAKTVDKRISELRGEIVADGVQTSQRILRDNVAALRELRGQETVAQETKFPPEYNPVEAYQQKVQQELLKQPEFPPEYDPVKEMNAELQRKLQKQPEFPPEYPPEYDPIEEFQKRHDGESDPVYSQFSTLPRMEDEKFPAVFYGLETAQDGGQNVIIVAFQPQPQVDVAV